MSATAPTAAVHAANVNNIVALAKDMPAQAAALEAVDPALAAQLTGSLATYLKSGSAPIVGMVVGLIAARLGMMCTDATAAAGACWTQDTVNTVTAILVMVGGAGVAALNHWWSKAPFRAVAAATPGAK